MSLQLNAQKRDAHGRGASRRLRRSGHVPAIIYGLNENTIPVSLDHNSIYYALKRPNFHTSILSITIDGHTEKVLLRDFQMHAYRPEVLHLDFQRVTDKEEIQIRIPLHFINEETSRAVKIQGAHITKIVNEVEIRAKASAIPHSIEVDLQNLAAGQSLHLSNLVVPKDIVLTSLLRGDDAVIVIAAGIVEEVEAEVTASVSAADVPTIAGQKSDKTEE